MLVAPRKVPAWASETRSPRGDDPLNEGLLGTAAPFYADMTLLIEAAMGVGLLIGALLARFGRFRQHAFCQSVIVLLNLALIVFMMVPSFRAHVSPKIPLRLGKAYYALATAHATLGSVSEIAGLYILYKAWMRTVLVLWWLVLLLGLVTYARWYVPHLFRK